MPVESTVNARQNALITEVAALTVSLSEQRFPIETLKLGVWKFRLR